MEDELRAVHERMAALCEMAAAASADPARSPQERAVACDQLLLLEASRSAVRHALVRGCKWADVSVAAAHTA